MSQSKGPAQQNIGININGSFRTRVVATDIVTICQTRAGREFFKYLKNYVIKEILVRRVWGTHWGDSPWIHWVHWRYGMKYGFLPTAREGNVFRSMCQPFCSPGVEGGGCWSVLWSVPWSILQGVWSVLGCVACPMVHPGGVRSAPWSILGCKADLPLDRVSPGQRPPLERTWDQTLSNNTHPQPQKEHGDQTESDIIHPPQNMGPDRK